MEEQYYIVENGQQAGPFTKEQLSGRNINEETLVWRVGLTEWVKLSSLVELADLLTSVADGGNPPTEELRWFAMINDHQEGPYTVETLISMGLKPSTPVWKAGMPDWVEASSQPELMSHLSRGGESHPDFSGNPQYDDRQPSYGQNQQYGSQQPNYGQNPQYGQQQPNYGQNPQYGQQQPNYGQNPQYGSQQPNYGPQPNYGRQPNYGPDRFSGSNSYFNQNNGYNNGRPYPNVHTNWLPWAIVATVISLCTSCVGVIFGVIAIVNANKANGLYAGGFEGLGDQANSTARVMTIIALVLAGIAIITSAIFYPWMQNFSF